jgi:methylmalonyl-CoA mutase C-terminal domain/subunit
MVERIRVLIAKPGLDGHDRGAKIVARALSEAGMEVIYTGIRQTVEQIVTAAVQEDVDVIGLSSLAGAHDTLFPQIIDMLRKKGKGDILVLGGGTVPPADAKRLREYGIAEIFGPGTKTQDIIAFVKKTAKSSRVRSES